MPTTPVAASGQPQTTQSHTCHLALSTNLPGTSCKKYRSLKRTPKNANGLRRGANPTASTFTFQRSLVLLCIPSIFETCLSTSCRSERQFSSLHIIPEASHSKRNLAPKFSCNTRKTFPGLCKKCQFSRVSPCLCAHVEVGVVSVPAPLPNVASHTFQRKPEQNEPHSHSLPTL